MIYTVTLNPSLDYIVSMNDFKLGAINRTVKEIIYPGGKGINVSMVLKNLGFDSTALGFAAGFTGEELKESLKRNGIETNFIQVAYGLTRINVKIRAEQESEINGQGPLIDSSEIDSLYERLGRLKEDDILILAGSVPKSMSQSIYRDIMDRLKNKGIKFIVDAANELLLNVLEYEPFLIKPNHHELSEIFHVEIHTKAEVIEYAAKLRTMGARNILVSMAGDGAVLVTETNEVYTMEAPQGEVKNSVGAGDSMVAGFIAGYLNTLSFKEAFRMGVCAGSASAFSEELAVKEEVEKLMTLPLQIKELSGVDD